MTTYDVENQSSQADKIRAYAASDREQAAILEWFAAISTDVARSAQLRAQAAVLRSTADDWDKFVAAGHP